MQHIWGRREKYEEFWWGSLRERYPAVDGKIILRRTSTSGMWWYGLDRDGSG